MAEAEHQENLLFYCDEHDGFPAETVSTNKFRWMCHGHLPIYLFREIEDTELVEFHHGVSNFSQQKIFKSTLKKEKPKKKRKM